MLLASLFISLNDAASKWMTASYPPGEILFVRSISLIAVLLVSSLGLRSIHRLRPASLRKHLARAGFYALSSVFFVLSLNLLALPVAVALSLASPLFVAALAGLLLGERVDWRHWCAVLVGLLGVLLVTEPFGSEWGWGVLVALAGALAGALRDIATRKLSLSESTPSILSVGVVLLAVMSLCTAPYGWTWPKTSHLLLFAFIGLSLGIAHYLIIEAFKSTEAAIVAPVQYSMLVWSVLFGFVFWGDVPSASSLMGSAAIVASGGYVMLSGRRATPKPTETN